MLKITAVGRLTADPVTGDANGYGFTRFTVATDTRGKNDKNEPLPAFLNTTVFTGAREACAKFLHKGDPVLIMGDFVPRPYTDKNGAERISFDVNVSDVQFLSSKKDNANNTNSNTNASAQTNTAPATNNNDDLPF